MCGLPVPLDSTLDEASSGAVSHVAEQWDVGYIAESCTPTRSGFDTFLGYYSACLSDYWYHWSPGQCDHEGPYIDFSNSSKALYPNDIAPGSRYLNGSYNAHVFTTEAVRLIRANGGKGPPMYFYLAYQNVHLACGNEPVGVAVGSGKKFGLQAPCPSVDLYATSVTDQIKVQGAMVTELDYGVGNVTAELVAQGMWENSVIFMVADNGAQMDHGKNFPLRGGKHTFWCVVSATNQAFAHSRELTERVTCLRLSAQGGRRACGLLDQLASHTTVATRQCVHWDRAQ